MRMVNADQYYDELYKMAEQGEISFAAFYAAASLLDKQSVVCDVDAVVDQITKATGSDGLVFYLDGKPVIFKEQAIGFIRSGGRQRDEQNKD